ncbi:MAG: NAD-dependent epimerase/dehydratase family protein [Armatimonadetes bacterium]|nr:NAD-dependent epimerase/dehydratase family protein [Armatimonadota bacterium]
MRILVTGGAGFIGSNVVNRFADLGHKVAVLDSLITGKRGNLDSRADFYEEDITDRDAVEKVFADFKPEIVDHHAAQIDVRKAVDDPVFDASVNVIGGINVVRAALAAGVSKFIYASTGGAIYGNPEVIPCSEEHPIRPISPYGLTKHVLEHYLALYAIVEGLRYTVLRYANVYGPCQDPKGEAGVNAIFTGLMLAGQQPTIFGKGDKTRDYVFVGDVVAANVLALDRAEGEIINIGTGIQTSDQEVYDAIAAATGFGEPPIYSPERKGEVRHIALDISKAKRVLGWEPQVSFREGVQMTVEYNKAQM